MIIKYSLSLYNYDSNLDLTKKRREIESCLKDIRAQKVGLQNYQILNIESHSLTIAVKEINDRWHQKFGNILANEYTMRRFCDENSISRMFKWTQI